MGTRVMKIAFVAHRYGGTGGGVERVVEELAKRFCLEHEVHVYAQSIVTGEGSQIYPHRIPQFRQSWSVNQALFFILSRLYLSGQQFDIVHLHAPSLYKKGVITCHGIPQAGLLALKHVTPELRREIPLRHIRRFIFMRPIIEYNFKRGRHKRVIAISSKINQDLVSICGTPLENISLVPNGVDLQRFLRTSRSRAREKIRKEFGLSQHHFVFLFVGNFFKRKGVQFLLPAFARLRDDSTRLIIVGSHEGENQWAKEMIEDLGVANKVVLAGEQKDVETFYAASDAFVFPSFYESFGLVLLEALACSLPVIASRTGGAEDLIQDNENGFLLSSPGNIHELAQKMGEILRDRALGKRMGEKAREKATLYSWDRVAEQTMVIYQKVIGSLEE